MLWAGCCFALSGGLTSAGCPEAVGGANEEETATTTTECVLYQERVRRRYNCLTSRGTMKVECGDVVVEEEERTGEEGARIRGRNREVSGRGSSDCRLIWVLDEET